MNPLFVSDALAKCLSRIDILGKISILQETVGLIYFSCMRKTDRAAGESLAGPVREGESRAVEISQLH